MTKFSQKIIEKIKTEKIQPIPRWHFVLRFGFVWLLAITFLILFLMIAGMLTLEIHDNEWDLGPILGMPELGFFMMIFPFLWLVILIAFGVLTYYNFVRTPNGYKLPGYQLIAFVGTLILFIVLGVYYNDTAKESLRFVRQHMPPIMRDIDEQKAKMWSKPERGFLSGTIDFVDGKKMELCDFNGKKWQVDFGKARIAPRVQLKQNEKVKLMGKDEGKNKFEAKDIRPWDKWEMMPPTPGTCPFEIKSEALTY